MAENQEIKIISVRPLNGRALRVEFNNGVVRLFDSHRLRGPKYIPLTDPNVYCTAELRDGGLYWEKIDSVVSGSFIYTHSVPYDDNAAAVKYEPTKRDILGERVALILFPLMAIAGLIGVIHWW